MNPTNWHDLSILITGGTGSFGKQFVRKLLTDCHPARIVVFSRDELKQHEMLTGGFDDPSMRFFIGDVRDRDRLRRALKDIDVVVHAAALKQVPACEYNPIEAIRTNVDGAANVIEAALDAGVRKVVALSTDKAVNPVNLYGATKLVSEKLFVQANSYSGKGPTRFSCVRYGNVVGSRGSVVSVFLHQRKTGTITITDKRMTRFWLTLEQGVDFVLKAIAGMHGGEVFVPRIPSMRVADLAEAMAPGCKVIEVGIRPGEKLHESLISEDEARSAVLVDGMFVIKPCHPWWGASNWIDGQQLERDFRYNSETNTEWLTADHLRKMLGDNFVASAA
jgi:UDP-N-acetylglucosamine 4,6-dehydratase/5-epimerase